MMIPQTKMLNQARQVVFPPSHERTTAPVMTKVFHHLLAPINRAAAPMKAFPAEGPNRGQRKCLAMLGQEEAEPKEEENEILVGQDEGVGGEGGESKEITWLMTTL